MERFTRNSRAAVRSPSSTSTQDNANVTRPNFSRPTTSPAHPVPPGLDVSDCASHTSALESDGALSYFPPLVTHSEDCHERLESPVRTATYGNSGLYATESDGSSYDVLSENAVTRACEGVGIPCTETADYTLTTNMVPVGLPCSDELIGRGAFVTLPSCLDTSRTSSAAAALLYSIIACSVTSSLSQGVAEECNVATSQQTRNVDGSIRGTAAANSFRNRDDTACTMPSAFSLTPETVPKITHKSGLPGTYDSVRVTAELDLRSCVSMTSSNVVSRPRSNEASLVYRGAGSGLNQSQFDSGIHCVSSVSSDCSLVPSSACAEPCGPFVHGAQVEDVELWGAMGDLSVNEDCHRMASASGEGGHARENDWVEMESEPFVQDENGDTELHEAVILRRPLPFFATLLQRCPTPAHLNIQNTPHRLTALQMAVADNRPEVVHLLALHGASLRMQDQRGDTSLHIACKLGYTDCLRVLLVLLGAERQAGGVVQGDSLRDLVGIRNFDGDTCLHLAVQSNHETFFVLIDALVRSNIDINLQEGKRGMTPLHLAVKRDDVTLVSALLPHVDPRRLTFDWRTALDLIRSDRRNSAQIQKLLEKYRTQYETDPDENLDDEETMDLDE